MNLILENSNQVEYYTYLDDVLKGIGNQHVNYNWLLSDIECNYYPVDFLRNDVVWLSGEELTELIQNYKIQFIWGVLSGFPKSLRKEDIDLSIIPYADGNGELWSGEVEIQHPLAEIEIVCWDSGSTLLITEDDTLSDQFLKFYSDAKNLDEMNVMTTNQVDYIKKVVEQYYETHGMKIDKSSVMTLAYSCRLQMCGDNYKRVLSSEDNEEIIKLCIK